MTADLLTLADRVRAEIVGRGHIPAPIYDASATRLVHDLWKQGAAELLVRNRLNHVLLQLAGQVQPSGAIHDAQIALGEYETLLELQREAAA